LIGKGKLVECEAGDLILWDSRSIHGGKIIQPNE
jgi:ectoine hydroxylase-related dioxygenase (phytanoyl-CoA dioxygenase family)